MRIAQKLTLGFSTVLLLVLAIGCICLYQLKELARPLDKDIPETIRAIDEQSRLHSLAQFIRYYDEVLTQSARNYAFTQDKKWEERYRGTEPKLDKIIKETIAKDKDAEAKEFFSSINKANLALVEMEYKSIGLVDKGHADEAVKILQSKEYWDQKKIYEQCLINYIHGEGAEYDQALSVSTEKIGLADKQACSQIKADTLLFWGIFAFTCIVLTVVGSVIIYSISKPIAKLKAAIVEIGNGRLDTHIEIDSKDEIGQLADCFNNMAEDLRKTTTSIDKLNQEITERRRAEEKNQQFAAIVESSNDAIIGKDTDGIITSWNKAAERIYGYTEADIIGKPISLLVPPEHRDETSRLLDKIKHEQHIERYETVRRRKDGNLIDVSLTISPIKNKEGRVVGASTIARDITERKKTQEELKFRNILLTTQQETSIDGILIVDEKGKIVSFNQRFIDMWGMPSEVIATLSDELALKSVLDKLAEPKQFLEKVEYLYTHQNETSQEEVSLKDGRTFDRYSAPMLGSDARYYGRVWYFRDITERKHADERLVKLFEKLENANSELKDFAYVVSHDLKASLRGIKTLAGWFSTDYADKVDENGKEQLKLLSSRVDRMHNLIDGVLQYSRIGRMEEKPANADFNEIVVEAIDMVAAPQNITVAVENELPEILCERTRITQVFQNLISNAVKYMDKPQGFVKIRCEDQQDFWRFAVEDNGPGIEEKYFERIFKIFQTLHSKDEYESTGIGLTLVKKIVELYGGTVWVESKVGQGSIFYFTLPKQRVCANDSKTPAQAVC